MAEFFGWKASVTSSKAVILGKEVICDGHENGYKVRIVTHAHSDHTCSLKESVRKCDLVISTKETKDILMALGRREAKLLVSANGGDTIKYGEEKIKLIPVEHILGTVQVLVEREDGTRCLYSSDFKLHGAPTVNCDVLVLDSTYGSPDYIRPDLNEVYDALLTIVEDHLAKGRPVHVFGFVGKLQDAMAFLRESKVDAPFIVSPRMYRVSKVYEKYGFDLGEFYSSEGVIGRKILEKGETHVAFFTPFEKHRSNIDCVHVELTGWLFRTPYIRKGENKYIVALSGHADFNQLIQYVERCRPKYVITDNSRGGQAEKLAKEIEKRLGIYASPSPLKNTKKLVLDN
ncbi:MAG: MBL fold metallo-hydrolase [Candidatus Jordarchaeales archaeon]